MQGKNSNIFESAILQATDCICGKIGYLGILGNF